MFKYKNNENNIIIPKISKNNLVIPNSNSIPKIKPKTNDYEEIRKLVLNNEENNLKTDTIKKIKKHIK